MSNVSAVQQFEEEKSSLIKSYANETEWHKSSLDWLKEAFTKRYMYNFSCLGRPIIQTPIDMVAMQELIWSVKPDLIIETGIAHGGSLILSASMLAMLDYCEAVEKGTPLDVTNPQRRVLAVDIDIRAHNLEAIKAHPMSNRIDMIQGSSIDPAIIEQVTNTAKKFSKVMVCLDSNHTHEHVLAELEAYAPLTSKGSYCIVFDTIVEDMPQDMFPDRPWKPGDNPKTAVWEYLKTLKSGKHAALDGDSLDFEIDKMIENKLLITVAPDGYLRRI